MKAISFNDFIPFTLGILLLPLTQCSTVNNDTKFETEITMERQLSKNATHPTPELSTKTREDIKMKTTSMKDKDKDKSTIEFSRDKGAEESEGRVEGRACPYCVGSDCDDNIPGYKFDPVFMSKLFIALFLGTVAYFCFLFAYKLWSFENIPYELSPSFDSPGPGVYSKMSGRAGSTDWNSVLSQTQSAIFKGIEKLY